MWQALAAYAYVLATCACLFCFRISLHVYNLAGWYLDWQITSNVQVLYLSIWKE
jgi:hypothetical protein